MRKILTKIYGYLKHLDPILFICTLLLSGISIFTILGAVDNFGMSKLKMQTAMTIVGLIITVIIANINYKPLIDKLWIFMLGVSVALLAVTLIFGSTGENITTTNKSWLQIPIIGISIQPSEFVKFAFVCTFGRHLYIVKDKINKPLTVLQIAVHALLVVGLILLSKDLGVALVYIGAIAIILFCAGLSLWYFLAMAVALVGLSPFIWEHLADYQKMRIIAGFDPSVDPEDKGWQALMSKQCIENGGLFGRGWLAGGDYEVLTASHTDFIFATICEKFGFIGGMTVIIILCVLIARILWIAYTARGDFGSIICVGVAAFMVVQILENLGMCLALLPVVGITLPFLSYGGSSMLATYMLVALVHSVKSNKTRAPLK